MRILRETNEVSAEELPISFITDLISKSWDEVGYLKEASEAIKSEYKGTEKVERVMQDLMDAYLVCIGQLELYLHKEDYIEATELPEEESEEKASDVASPKDTEEVEPEVKPLPAAAIEPEELAITEVNPMTPPPALAELDDEDAFEFFVDFDEPDMSAPRLTDAELYGEDKTQKDKLYS
jgi:hypothetical protein